MAYLIAVSTGVLALWRLNLNVVRHCAQHRTLLRLPLSMLRYAPLWRRQVSRVALSRHAAHGAVWAYAYINLRNWAHIRVYCFTRFTCSRAVLCIRDTRRATAREHQHRAFAADGRIWTRDRRADARMLRRSVCTGIPALRALTRHCTRFAEMTRHLS